MAITPLHFALITKYVASAFCSSKPTLPCGSNNSILKKCATWALFPGTVTYVYIYTCLWTKKNLNRTLAIDSPFQTFAVGLLVKILDFRLDLPLFSPEMLSWLSKLRIFLFNAHHALFVRRMA